MVDLSCFAIWLKEIDELAVLFAEQKKALEEKLQELSAAEDGT